MYLSATFALPTTSLNKFAFRFRVADKYIECDLLDFFVQNWFIRKSKQDISLHVYHIPFIVQSLYSEKGFICSLPIIDVKTTVNANTTMWLEWLYWCEWLYSLGHTDRNLFVGKRFLSVCIYLFTENAKVGKMVSICMSASIRGLFGTDCFIVQGTKDCEMYFLLPQLPFVCLLIIAVHLF